MATVEKKMKGVDMTYFADRIAELPMKALAVEGGLIGFVLALTSGHVIEVVGFSALGAVVSAIVNWFIKLLVKRYKSQSNDNNEDADKE